MVLVRRWTVAIVAGAVVLLSFPLATGAAPGTTKPAVQPVLAADTPATALRVLLGRLLGEHSFLLMESIRAESFDARDAGALRAALDANSADLSDAIGSVYGAAARDGFSKLWDQHIDLLIAHAEAKREGRAGDADAALAALTRFRHDFAQFLASANPMIDGHGEADAVQLHLDQVIAFTDGDYVKAYEAEREAFRHMFAFGDHLARAIGTQFPDKFAGATVAWSPTSNLRLALGRLLAEHLVLSAEAMRSGMSDAPDAPAARAALDANSTDLAAAIGSYYGQEAEAAFHEVWNKHVIAYLDFIDAYAQDDDAARSRALMALHAYHNEIATFLAAANPHLTETGVSDLIRRHVQSLITQVEATAAGDHVRAIATVRSGYAFMFEVGDALSSAIAAQFPDKFKEIKALPPTDVVRPAAPATTAPFGVLLGAAVMGILYLVARQVDANSRRRLPVDRPRR
jgi:hypothetical protein